MIRRILLKNWKSHLNSELNFSPGANVLVGIMGSGKTSVIEAVCFALFGNLPSLQSKKIILDDLIMSEPERKKSSTVELEFEVNGDTYIIKREIERGKGTKSAEIRKNGEIINVNPKNVTEIVERTLQMDYDLFSKAVYSEQNGIDYFLRIPKGHRTKHIDRMLKLDLYERARESAVFIKNKLKAETSQLIKIISDIEDEKIDEKLKNISSEIEALRKEGTHLEEIKSKTEKELKILEEKLTAFESKDREIVEITKNIESIKFGINDIESSLKEKREKIKEVDIAHVSSIEDLSNEIELYKKELERKRAKESKLRTDIASKNTRLKYLRNDEIPQLEKKSNEIAKYKKELLRLRERMPDPEMFINKKMERLEKEKEKFYKIQSRRDELIKHIEYLKSDRCPTCESELTEKKRSELTSKKQKEIKNIEKNIPRLESELKKMQRELEEAKENTNKMHILEEKAKEYDNIKNRLNNIEKEVITVSGEVNKIAKELVLITPNIQELEKKIEEKNLEKEKAVLIKNTIEGIQELESKRILYEKKLKWLESQREKIAASLEGINVSEIRDNLRSKTAEASETSAKLEALKEKLKDKTETLIDLRKRKQTFEKYKKEVTVNEKIIRDVESFVKVLKITQQQLREEFVKTVNILMNDIWGDIYPYNDFNEIKLTIEDDYILQLRRGERWISVDTTVSGGERSMACLALRIAFSLAFIPNLKWLILDEPTHNLDSNAIENFSTMLSDKINKFAEQVFVITHEERISEGLENVYMLERNKELNKPTRVLKI